MDISTIAGSALLMKASQTQQSIAISIMKQAAQQQQQMAEMLAQSAAQMPQPMADSGFSFSTYA